MRYIVTGSLGLVGMAACKRLLREGHEVYGIDCNAREEFFGIDGSTRHKLLALRSYPNYVHRHADIASKEELDRAFRKGFDRVIHCAAQPSHDWATDNIDRDFEINAIGTLNVLNLAFGYNPDAPMVHISTSKVYGDNPNRLPLIEAGDRLDLEPDHPMYNGLREDFPVDNCLHSFFGCSKLTGDLYAQEYGRHKGMKVGIFRPGCVTGSDHAGVPLHGFLAYLAKCIKEGKTYNIIGYEGKQVRCNIHADDLVDACITYLDNPRPGAVYNVGGRELSCSIIEATHAMAEISGMPSISTYKDTPRTGDHRWYISDMGKFRREYNWEPKRTLQSIYEELCQ